MVLIILKCLVTELKYKQGRTCSIKWTKVKLCYLDKGEYNDLDKGEYNDLNTGRIKFLTRLEQAEIEWSIDSLLVDYQWNDLEMGEIEWNDLYNREVK